MPPMPPPEQTSQIKIGDVLWQMALTMGAGFALSIGIAFLMPDIPRGIAKWLGENILNIVILFGIVAFAATLVAIILVYLLWPRPKSYDAWEVFKKFVFTESARHHALDITQVDWMKSPKMLRNELSTLIISPFLKKHGGWKMTFVINCETGRSTQEYDTSFIGDPKEMYKLFIYITEGQKTFEKYLEELKNAQSLVDEAFGSKPTLSF